MEWGPVDGQYTAGDLPPSLGGTRPDAVVTLNAVPTTTDYCGAWLRWRDMHCWRFGFTEEGLPGSTPILAAGRNTLVYEATFEDGESMQITLEVVYDPTLTIAEGFLLDVIPGDPARAVVAFVELEIGAEDGLDVVGTPVEETLPIADDAAFIILEYDSPGNRPERARTTEELLELIEAEESGNATTHLFWGFLLPEDDMIGGVPSTFLITADGELQQMEQWWMP